MSILILTTIIAAMLFSSALSLTACEARVEDARREIDQ